MEQKIINALYEDAHSRNMDFGDYIFGTEPFFYIAGFEPNATILEVTMAVMTIRNKLIADMAKSLTRADAETV